MSRGIKLDCHLDLSSFLMDVNPNESASFAEKVNWHRLQETTPLHMFLRAQDTAVRNFYISFS